MKEFFVVFEPKRKYREVLRFYFLIVRAETKKQALSMAKTRMGIESEYKRPVAYLWNDTTTIPGVREVFSF